MLQYKDIQRNNFKYRANLIKKATKEEIKIREFLQERGVYFIFQKGFLKPFHRIVDFYIPGKKVIIEIDGGYHNLLVNKDLTKDRLFREKRGMSTVRISNDEVLNGKFRDKLNFLSYELSPTNLLV